MEYLVGKYFYIEYPASSYGTVGGRMSQTLYYKVLAYADGYRPEYPTERQLLVINILDQKISEMSIHLMCDHTMCVSIPKIDADADLVMAGDCTLYVKDHYLHRIGGPALSLRGQNRYYLLGKEIEKDVYLELMPEDVQTEMVFKINEM